MDNDAIPYSQEVYPEKSFFFFGARIPREKLVDSASGEASVSAMVLIESLQNTWLTLPLEFDSWEAHMQFYKKNYL